MLLYGGDVEIANKRSYLGDELTLKKVQKVITQIIKSVWKICGRVQCVKHEKQVVEDQRKLVQTLYEKRSECQTMRA